MDWTQVLKKFEMIVIALNLKWIKLLLSLEHYSNKGLTIHYSILKNNLFYSFQIILKYFTFLKFNSENVQLLLEIRFGILIVQIKP